MSEAEAFQCFAEGKYDRALDLFREIEAPFNVAKTLEELGRTQEAISVLTKLLDEEKDLAVGYFQRAGCYLKLGGPNDIMAAVDDYHYALRIFRTHEKVIDYRIFGMNYSLPKVDVLCNRAIANCRLEQYKDAQADLKEAKALLGADPASQARESWINDLDKKAQDRGLEAVAQNVPRARSSSLAVGMGPRPPIPGGRGMPLPGMGGGMGGGLMGELNSRLEKQRLAAAKNDAPTTPKKAFGSSNPRLVETEEDDEDIATVKARQMGRSRTSSAAAIPDVNALRLGSKSISDKRPSLNNVNEDDEEESPPPLPPNVTMRGKQSRGASVLSGARETAPSKPPAPKDAWDDKPPPPPPPPEEPDEPPRKVGHSSYAPVGAVNMFSGASPVGPKAPLKPSDGHSHASPRIARASSESSEPETPQARKRSSASSRSPHGNDGGDGMADSADSNRAVVNAPILSAGTLDRNRGISSVTATSEVSHALSGTTAQSSVSGVGGRVTSVSGSSLSSPMDDSTSARGRGESSTTAASARGRGESSATVASENGQDDSPRKKSIPAGVAGGVNMFGGFNPSGGFPQLRKTNPVAKKEPEAAKPAEAPHTPARASISSNNSTSAATVTPSRSAAPSVSSTVSESPFGNRLRPSQAAASSVTPSRPVAPSVSAIRGRESIVSRAPAGSVAVGVGGANLAAVESNVVKVVKEDDGGTAQFDFRSVLKKRNE